MLEDVLEVAVLVLTAAALVPVLVLEVVLVNPLALASSMLRGVATTMDLAPGGTGGQCDLSNLQHQSTFSTVHTSIHSDRFNVQSCLGGGQPLIRAAGGNFGVLPDGGRLASGPLVPLLAMELEFVLLRPEIRVLVRVLGCGSKAVVDGLAIVAEGRPSGFVLVLRVKDTARKASRRKAGAAKI